MPSQTYEQQVMWAPANSPATTRLDMSAKTATQPRRVGDGRRSFSFQSFRPDGDTGTPKGKLVLQLSNAPVAGAKLVEPAGWVDQDVLTWDVGGRDELPAAQQVAINCSGWARLEWRPDGGSTGHLLTFFDGVRL